MLLRIKIKNYLSFYNESTFDMFPNLKRTTFPNHIYDDKDVPLLKQAVIYGANGSGKSNLLSAICFIKDFAIKRKFITEDILSKNKFRLRSNENTDPIKISIEFKNETNYYIYSVSLNLDTINEELYLSGIGIADNVLVYRRTGNKVESNEISSDEIFNATTKLLENNPYSSLLSLNEEFPILNDKNLKVVFNWFNEKLKTLHLTRILPSLIDLMSRNEALLKFANHIFDKIGLGVKSLEIKSDKLNDLLNSNFEDAPKIREILKKNIEAGSGITKMQFEKILFTIVKEKDEQLIKRFIFKQTGFDDYIGNMDIADQSDGTVKILNLIPALYDAIEKDNVICIDEIENSIHPSLITALIAYYSNSQSKGQLIFTTHETELLNQQKYMRSDEVWFTEKHNGDTKLYSLNDFKEHNTINIKNGYLEGRYGGIPFIGNLGE
jgi:AAA15 family ATPase/GTPase